MSQPRPTSEEIAAAIQRAAREVRHGREVRRRYRRRRGAPNRETHLKSAHERCGEMAKPLRSWLGMVAWGGISLEDELAMKKAMEDLRYERRQIGKML